MHDPLGLLKNNYALTAISFGIVALRVVEQHFYLLALVRWEPLGIVLKPDPCGGLA